MTADWHHTEAERLLAGACDEHRNPSDSPESAAWIAAAQVHALLALTGHSIEIVHRGEEQ